MKKALYIAMALFMAFIAMPAMAKKDPEARKVLDAMAQKISSAGGIKASFMVTTYSGKNKQGSSSGTMYVSGKKLMINTPEMKTWFDGKTQWTYMTNTEEVNVSTPTAAEIQQMNPYAFIGIYRSGFDYTIKETKYKGKTVQEVRLLAEKKGNGIQEILVTVDKATKTPLCVRIRQGSKSWTRINVNSFSAGQKFSDATFKFNKAQYPKAEIIDLR